MNKKILFSIISFFAFSGFIFAENDIVTITKYYKTITNLNDFIIPSSINNYNYTQTYEITKDEYESSLIDDISILGNVETSYKKLTATISKVNSSYRYKAILTWKNMPKIRSYDIMGIYFSNDLSVKSNSVLFKQEYCINNNCYLLNDSNQNLFNNGVGVSFKLPTENISSLKQTLYFDVVKNNSSIINTQYIVADYSHAIKNVSLEKSKKFIINSNGIVINNSVLPYYDNIDGATVTLNGKW